MNITKHGDVQRFTPAGYQYECANCTLEATLNDDDEPGQGATPVNKKVYVALFRCPDCGELNPVNIDRAAMTHTEQMGFDLWWSECFG